MAHATSDIHHIRMAAGMGLVALVDAVLLGASTIGFMAYINVRLTLFTIIPMPLIVISTRIFSRKMHHAYQSVQEAYSHLTERVREHFTGIRIIKAYTLEERSARVVEAASRDCIDRNVRLVWITGAFFPMMLLFSNISLALVIYLGGRQTIFNRITPGDFVAFISYLGLLTWPMMAIGWLINLIQRGRASLERIGTVLDTAPEIADSPAARPFPGLAREISVEALRFRYSDRTPLALDGIDLRVPKGSTLGIVGPPGAGKTTLLSLLTRILDASSGKILFDGVDIRDFNIADLRASIAYVPQEPFLFAGTLRENITFGAEVPEADMRRALDMAALEKTLQNLPRGLDTVVGEKGVILSGGQKQRVALARAFLRERPILVLDDPISQVDAETGDAIISAVRALTGRCTLIIVSHRISAVQFADSIITLDAGRITESGTHRKLIARGGYYARTSLLQQIQEAPDAA
jgi:ATP-binding cassette subfamily B protein